MPDSFPLRMGPELWSVLWFLEEKVKIKDKKM